MIIFVDKKGLEVIADLCDAALRVGGLSNRDVVNEVMGSMKPLPPAKPEPDPPKGD